MHLVCAAGRGVGEGCKGKVCECIFAARTWNGGRVGIVAVGGGRGSGRGVGRKPKLIVDVEDYPSETRHFGVYHVLSGVLNQSLGTEQTQFKHGIQYKYNINK